MRYILITGLVLITLSFPQSLIKCGLEDLHTGGDLLRTDPPVNQTSHLSPEGIFYIHYDTTAVGSADHRPLPGDDNMNNIPDFVEMVAIMADSAHHLLVDILGYDSQPPDQDGIYDIYLRDDLNAGWYGVTYYNSTMQNGSSFIVIDNDFSPEEGFYTTGYDAMKVTVIHEFFHGIQFGYSAAVTAPGGIDNRFFYEMSSTWLEDVAVPEVNDYLSLRSNFFSDPAKSIDDTNGYSVALYCHYLATTIEGLPDEHDTHILREMWTNFSNASHKNAMTSMEYILNVNYSMLFIETWLDWVSRNLYNTIDENYYYYGDQALIGPVTTTPVQLNFNSSFQDLQVDKYSAAIKSYRVVHPHVRLEIQLVGVYYTGFVIVVSSDAARNIIYPAVDLFDTGPLSAGDEVHFILGNTIFNNGVVDGDIRLLFTPNPPEIMGGFAVQDSIKLIWSSVDGPGDILNYLVQRDWISGQFAPEATDNFVVYDTIYYDHSVLPGSTYEYRVSARNESGYSELSDPVILTAWPDPGNVSDLRIVNAYPNPVEGNSGIPLFLILDSDQDYESLTLQIYNILGQSVYRKIIPSLEQGRHRIPLGEFIDREPASGIYFIRILDSAKKLSDKKIHIIR